MIAKNRKIYTKRLATAVVAPLGIATEYHAADLWLVQDDIEIIGAQIDCTVCAVGETGTGIGAVDFDVSQVGLLAQDGLILQGTCAFSYDIATVIGKPGQANVGIIFPEGSRMVVKEEGHVYLNMIVFGANIAILTIPVCLHGTIYYHKV